MKLLTILLLMATAACTQMTAFHHATDHRNSYLRHGQAHTEINMLPDRANVVIRQDSATIYIMQGGNILARIHCASEQVEIAPDYMEFLTLYKTIQ